MTRTEYERGASLKAARGHAATPERPSRAYQPQNREKYSGYLERRATLERKVAVKKQEIWGATENFNARRSQQNIHEMPTSGDPAKMANMARFIELGEDLFDEPDFDWDDDQWEFLYYH
jgi:hypothetical protein